MTTEFTNHSDLSRSAMAIRTALILNEWGVELTEETVEMLFMLAKDWDGTPTGLASKMEGLL